MPDYVNLDQTAAATPHGEPGLNAPPERLVSPAVEGLTDLVAAVEGALDQRLPATGPAPRLIGAMRHTTLAPSKRFRGVAVVLLGDAAGCDRAAALDLASAIEMLHAASLTFDDLPCMDDAPIRRGRPSVHSCYSENIAILSGLSLLTLSFGVIAKSEAIPADLRAPILGVLADAVGHAGLSAGQELDLNGAADGVDLDRIVEAHRLKTASLFTAGIESVVLLGGLPAPCAGALRSFADSLGLAFQAYDDLIDISRDQTSHGKTLARDGDKLALSRVMDRHAVEALFHARVQEVNTALDAVELDLVPLKTYVGSVLARSFPI